MDNNVVAKHILDVAVGLEKKSKAELITELSDIFDNASKIDLNSKENINSLKNLAKAFEAIFSKAGDKSINFADLIEMPPPAMFAEMGKIAATSFWDAWNSVSGGISGNVSKEMLREQFKQLEEQRANLVKRQKAWPKKQKEYEDLSLLVDDLPYMDKNEFSAFTKDEIKKMGGNVEKIALDMQQALTDALDDLSDTKLDDPKFDAVLEDTLKKAHEVFRMSKTLEKHPTLVKDKSLLEEYDFEYLKENYADLTDEAGHYSVRLDGIVRKVSEELEKIPLQLQEIDNKIVQIKNSGVDIIDQASAKDGLKTLEEIKKAYDDILIADKTRIDHDRKVQIEKALEFDPLKTSKGIKTFYEQYQNAAASGNWIDEYRALLKYVRLYESYMTSTNKTWRNKVTREDNPFTPLYKQLKPMAENAQNMLQNLLNMEEGKPLVGIGGDGSGSSADTSDEVANAERIAKSKQMSAEKEAEARREAEAKEEAERKTAEEIERQAKAEKEKAAAIKQQRIEEEKLAKAAEKKKLADEAAAEAKRKAAAESGVMQAMEKFQGEFEKTDKKNETLAFVNTTTGNMSELFVGDPHGVTMDPGTSRKMSELGYDMEVHSHSWKTAAPSVDDLESWFKQFGYIQKFAIRAGEELLILDFSKLNPAQLLEVIEKYKDLDERLSAQVQSMNYDEQIEKFGSFQGRQEAVQAMLRQGLEEILQDIPGVIKSIKMPELPVANIYNKPQPINKDQKVGSLDDEFARANEELKELIKNYAILTKNRDSLNDDEYDELVHVGEKIENVAPNLLDIPVNQWQSFGEKVIAAEQAVDGLNESLEKTQQLTSGGGTGSGVGDDSSSELENLRQQLEAKDTEITEANRKREEAELAERAAQAEAAAERHATDAAEAQLAEANQRTKEAEERVYMYDRAMTSMEEEMADLRGKLANDGDAIFAAEQRANEAEERANQLERKIAESFDGDKRQGSVSTEELKTLLNSIVYNVKIAHDDNDKTANKIEINESTLESTLTKVFANILNPQTQQNDSEPKQAPWALDNTLKTVKGVLDNIHTNTSKIGTIAPSNVDAIAGTALDGRLADIKSVLESIDNKIAKGGVIATRGAVKQANAQAVESDAKTQAARSNMMKSLINDYKTLGKLSAKFASDGDLETKARLDNLKEEISRKRKSLKLSMDESASLREKYSMAFDAEKRLLDAEKAQEEINKKKKKDDKEAETAWKKQVKDAQRATGINAATSAANAGDQTVVRAIGTEGISKGIESKAKELAERIKALRDLRDEIDKKGEQATNEDRDNLSKQIAKVKELKTEVDGYLKIHEKYSGEGATQLNDVDTSNFGAVGTDQYWNNITEAIKNASSGRVTIKGMNADTGELTGTTKIAANTFAEWSATVDPVTGKLSMLRTGIKRTETIIESITRKTKEIFTYFSGSSIIFKAFNELKKGVQYVKEIDLALTELKKVTDETEETYDRFLKTAAKTADRVGSTIQKVVSSTADWARLGYSMKEAAEFAESTQILMNVSEFTDVSQATDTLISAVQAFGYTAETSMDVVDLLNTIGKMIAYR